jgi:hypothetical protein
LALVFFAWGTSRAEAAPLLVEDFNDISTLAGAGWVQTNNSAPVGPTGWFQGNDGVFGAQAGPPNAYIAANFENAAFGGNISNWLLTPSLILDNGSTLSFWSRTVDVNTGFPDRLEVRLSTNGSSTNVGSTVASVGDFTTLLLTINSGLVPGGYPDTWTNYTATVSGLGGPTNGRLAFRYFVPDTSVNADYIGIDTVNVSASVSSVPEPATLVTTGLGLLLLYGRRRGLKLISH